MIVSHRGMCVPELGVVAFDHSVLLPRLRVQLMSRRGVLVDDALFAPAFPMRLDGSRANLILVLAGVVRVRSKLHEVELREGSFLIERRDAGWGMRYEGAASVLVFEWCAAQATRQGPSRVAPGMLATLRRAIAPLADEAASREALERGLLEAITSLRAIGAPLDVLDASELRVPAPPGLREISLAADQAVRRLAHAPASVDLESDVGWSSRHVQRRLRSLHAQYGFNAQGGVRDLLHRWRVYAAALLATAPGATTERVAELTGYSGPAPLCRALAQRGLPSPGAVRAALAAMG